VMKMECLPIQQPYWVKMAAIGLFNGGFMGKR